MKNLVLAGLLVFSVASFAKDKAAAETWNIDTAHSSAKFKIKHMTISTVSGAIGNVQGAFTLEDPKNVKTLKMEANLDMKTINTNDAKRDEHLRNPDFFDAAKYPTMKFVSKEIVPTSGGKFKVVGDLTIKDVTKPVTLESDGLTPAVKDPWGNEKRGFAAKGKINRKDWGITYNKKLDSGGWIIGEDVNIEIEVELEKKKS